MIEVSDKWRRNGGFPAQCDEYAARSQQRLAAAYQNGITGDEIVPFVYPATKKDPGDPD